MVVILLFLVSIDIDLEVLYDKATTRLVSFQTVKDSAVEEFVSLGKHPSTADTVLAFLVSKFDTKSSIERHTLKNILKEIGTPAIKWIASRMDYRGSDAEARSLKQSLWVLGEIGSEQIIEPVAHFSSDRAWTVRSGAFTALGKSKSNMILPYVIEGLDDSVALVRKSAYYALGEIATEHELNYLLHGLEDDFYGVRYAALSGIKRVGFGEAWLAEELSGNDIKDYFMIYALADLDIEYGIDGFVPSVSPATRKAVYDILSEPLLIKALERENHPLLKKYLKKKIEEHSDNE
jgi:HEAT repeat protein